MALQWLNRLFSRTDGPVMVRTKAGARSQVIARPKTPPSLFREYFSELDQAFLFFVTETPEDQSDEREEEATERARALTRRLLQGKLRLENLPRRPASLPMLIKVLKDDDLAFSEIAEILLSDPALTSRILNTANSPFFKTGSESVDTIEHAIRLLGTGGIRRVISATVMNPVFRNRNSKESSAFSEYVWSWALMSGSANDRYGQASGLTSGSLYLLGLLPALSLLLIQRSLEDLQAESFGDGEIDIWTRMAVIGQMRWSLCKRIRKHWGLSEQYDDLIAAAEHAGNPGYNSPLHDALTLAMYAYLKRHECCPLNEQQVFTLISGDAVLNRKILAELASMQED